MSMRVGTLKDRIEDSFARRDKKKAISFCRDGKVETRLSYGELNQDANRCAHTLQEMGVTQGDRVVLFVNKSLIFVVAHLALQKIGAVVVPLNPGFKASEMDYLLNDADPKLVVTDPAQKGMISKLAPRSRVLPVASQKPYQDLDFFRAAGAHAPEIDLQPDDPALIIYTSGTTGNPKGAVLTHRNLVHDAQNVIKIWEITATDVLCHALPLFHVHGLCFALHTALLAGSGVIMLDQFKPAVVVEVLARSNQKDACTVFMAVPAMYTKMMDTLGRQRLNFDHIRLWTSGSAPLLVKDLERIQSVFGKEPVEREGMSETGMNFSNPLKGRRKPGSIGLPLPGLEVRIVDPDTLTDVAPGRVGEIWLKSPAITPGYWRKPAATSETFKQGWFRTGDLGRVDEDGYYYLTDRIKHIIITGGENVSAQEVETVINRVDNVLESSVVGIPDEKWGEKVVAAVVAKPGSDLKPDVIKDFCKEHLHDWKCPKEIIFPENLPKNTMGKVLKEEVKKLFRRGY
ncbi:MAG: acyl--CoA ligase [Desulfobacterales bacterium]|nr:MAG: acyl--CoA ligase [Desulfobacterales bacterium]